MKYVFTVDASAFATFEIEAADEDEAAEKMDKMIEADDFFINFREACDFANVFVEEANE